MSKPKNKGEDIVAEAKKRLAQCMEAEGDFRTLAEEDLKFAFCNDPKDQWDQNVLKERGNRPCYTYNRVGEVIDQVVNDQRQSRPQIKVRGVDDNTDQKLADIYNGLIRNIEAMSDAESIYDDAFDYAARGGFGYWRVLPEYSSDTTFEQDLYVRAVESQFSVYMDPAAKHQTKRDANWGLLSVWMSRDSFISSHGKDALVPFEEMTEEELDDWVNEEMIRVAEYYRKVPKIRTLLQFSDNRVMFKDEIEEVLDEMEAEGITVTKEREVESSQVEWYKISGAQVLEGPITYDCQWVPIVRVVGKRMRIDNQEYVKGITRDAKDAQRSYNYMRSDLAEDVLMKPKAPVFLSHKTVENEAYRKIWKNAHKALFNFLPFIPDPTAPNGGAPILNQSSGIDAGKLAVMQQDIVDIKATTGHFDPALGDTEGQGPNPMSGVAVQRWQDRSGNAAFIFHDNHAKAIEQTGRILVELIPGIYDTERVIRIIGKDGSEEFVKINSTETDQQTGKTKLVGDITKAKFDVTVDTGPNYSTQRQEASEKLMALGEAWPAVFEIAPDIIAKGIDIPNADEFIRRVRMGLITKGIVKPNKDDQDEMALAESLKQQQNPAVDMLLQAQAQESQANAQSSMADVQAKRAKAARDIQEAIKVTIENMVAEHKLRVDPTGMIEAMLSKSNGSMM